MTRDIVIAPARRGHRKSKFRLRHGIKLTEIYAMTKSEFGFYMIRVGKSKHNVPNPDSVPPVYSSFSNITIAT